MYRAKVSNEPRLQASRRLANREARERSPESEQEAPRPKIASVVKVVTPTPVIPATTGSLVRRAPRKIYHMSVTKEDAYFFTHGHGPLCRCSMCPRYFRKDNGGFLPDRLLDAAYTQLLKEQLIQPHRVDPTVMEVATINTFTHEQKADRVRELAKTLQEVDFWIERNQGRLREYRPMSYAESMTALPDIRYVVIDENGIIGRNQLCQVQLDLTEERHQPWIRPRPPVNPNRGEVWQQTMAINIEGVYMNVTNPGPDATILVEIDRTISLLKAYNQARFVTQPLKIYVIGGQATLREEGTDAALVIHGFIKDVLMDGTSHVTWMGTGLGKPASEEIEYRQMAKRLCRTLRTPDDPLTNAYDFFHGRQGDDQGYLEGSHVREAYAQQLFNFVVTGDPYHIPPWASPRYIDNKINPLRSIGPTPRRIASPEENEAAAYVCGYVVGLGQAPSCSYCGLPGHGENKCNAKAFTQSQHYVGRKYVPKETPRTSRDTTEERLRRRERQLERQQRAKAKQQRKEMNRQDRMARKEGDVDGHSTSVLDDEETLVIERLFSPWVDAVPNEPSE